MHRSSTQGFTLIEALIATTIVMIALLMGMGLVAQQPGIQRRLQAQREALHGLEGTLEALRAGALPLASQRIDAAGDRTIWVDVGPAGHPPGLYRVSVRTLWRIEGKVRERSIETLIWRPPT